MRKNGKAITYVAAMLVFAVFTVGIVSVLLGGAGIYQRLTRRDQCAYERRTAAQYLATKMRQSEAMPRVERFGSGDALVLSQEIDGVVYLTRIYCHDGWLRELFAAAEGSFSPEDGEKLLPMDSLEIKREGNLLTFRLKRTGEEDLLLTLLCRLGKGAQP